MTDHQTNETARLLQDTANRLFSEHFDPRALAAAERGHFHQAAWEAVAEAGLPRALLSEAEGGYGINLADALLLLRVAGAHAVPLPIAETMLAAWLLAGAGLPVPDGPLSIATGPTLERSGSFWHLAGTAHAVPWGRHATAVALFASPFVCLLPTGAGEVTLGSNMAGEPRDTITYDLHLTADQIAPVATDAARLHAFGAAIRTVMLAGAMTRVAEMTARYAQERVQFGRPIAKFQAIQQSLAALAGQVAAAVAAGDIAAQAVANGIQVLPIACAKLRAGVVAGLAHQVHGAIGFTYEHSLHYFTKRLWAWRDEYGDEGKWSLMVGRHVASAGADRLWAEITNI
jgi:acyl-CoA dehydrogenase